MHARVTTATIQRDKIDECIRIWRDSVVREARQQKGLRDLLFFIDRSTGKSIVCALWESEADLHATEASGHFQAQVAKISPLAVGQPTREIFEVTVNDLATLKPGTQYGRITTVMLQRDKVDESTRILRDSIIPEARKQKGFSGLLSMMDRGLGKGITLALWESDADMKAGESSGYYQTQIAKLQPLFMGQPTRETYEAIVPMAMVPAMGVDTQVQPPTP